MVFIKKNDYNLSSNVHCSHFLDKDHAVKNLEEEFVLLLIAHHNVIILMADFFGQKKKFVLLLGILHLMASNFLSWSLFIVRQFCKQKVTSRED